MMVLRCSKCQAWAAGTSAVWDAWMTDSFEKVLGKMSGGEGSWGEMVDVWVGTREGWF